MKKTVQLALTVSLASFLLLALAPAPVQAGPIKVFTASLSGAQEVPPNGSEALGTALVTFDETANMLCFAISFTPHHLRERK